MAIKVLKVFLRHGTRAPAIDNVAGRVPAPEREPGLIRVAAKHSLPEFIAGERSVDRTDRADLSDNASPTLMHLHDKAALVLIAPYWSCISLCFR